ncbi:MAG: hypothetical protein ABI960_05255 [Candidatus Eisenbacteria bacterium]
MDRLRHASETLSRARRHLFETHPEGTAGAIASALTDVREALDELGDEPLPAPWAAAHVQTLRSALASPRSDRAEIYVAVDELASLLYWTGLDRA